MCKQVSDGQLAILVWSLTNNKKSGEKISVCLENCIPASCLLDFAAFVNVSNFSLGRVSKSPVEPPGSCLERMM